MHAKLQISFHASEVNEARAFVPFGCLFLRYIRHFAATMDCPCGASCNGEQSNITSDKLDHIQP